MKARGTMTTDIYKSIQLKFLEESKTNPRKSFNEVELNELANSIKQHGLIQPIVVRLIKTGNYEVVAGARRFRALKLAGLKEIPAVIKELTDEQALEVQIIENLQRKDIHELEEAEGFQNLLNTGKYDVQAVADKFGKSHTFVYQRLKLNNLIERVKTLFYDNFLTHGHCFLLCRLTKEKQDLALRHLVYTNCTAPWEDIDKRPELKSNEPRTFGQLKQWINENTEVDLSSAPFKLDISFSIHEQEFSKSGALKSGSAYQIVPCMECPKNSSNNNVLWPEYNDKAICTDKSCYDKKVQQFMQDKFEKLKAENPKAKKGSICASTGTTPKGTYDLYRTYNYETVKKNDKEAVPVLITEKNANYDIFKNKNVGDVIYIKEKPKHQNTSTAKPKSSAEIEKEKDEKAFHDIKIISVTEAKITIAKKLMGKIKFDDMKFLKLLFALVAQYVENQMNELDADNGEYQMIKETFGFEFECKSGEVSVLDILENEYKTASKNAQSLKDLIVKGIFLADLRNDLELNKNNAATLEKGGTLIFNPDFLLYASHLYGTNKEISKAFTNIQKRRTDEYKKKKADENKPKDEVKTENAEPNKKKIAAIPNKSKKSKKK